jgi:hypothetical protein
LKKILVTIQGKTLILHYQVKHGLARKGSGWASYIRVLPSAELARFDLKGLTPEMFCVNISDMVNIRGQFSGQAENEKQVPVARWELNHEDYLQAISIQAAKLTHRQIVDLLASLPGYLQETDNQFIDFEERIVPHGTGEPDAFSGYRLTIVTEGIEDKAAPYAYYNLDTHTREGWRDYPPPQADYEPILSALENLLQAIREAGVPLAQVDDETDYAIAG